MSRILHAGVRVLIGLARPLKDRPVFYRARSFQIVGYGVFAMVASILMMFTTVFYLTIKGESLTPEFLVLIPLMGILAWLGSRGMHLVALGRKFWTKPAKYVSETGFYVQGGIFGGLVAVLLVAYLVDVRLVVLADGLAWSAMLGLVLGRLGCYSYGCCYGREIRDNDTPGIRYRNPEVKALRLKPQLQGRKIHASQLYTAVVNGLAFVVVALLIPLSLPNGLVCGLFLLYHGLSRIALERLRGDIFFDAERNWTTYRTAALMVGLGVLTIVLGPRFLPGFGEIVPLVEPYHPGTLYDVCRQTPSLVLSVTVLGVLVLFGFGLHGRKLGSFPGSPQNRGVPTLGEVQYEPEC